MESTVFFLPTRRGSQRVKNKNTRPFANIAGGLLENKLSQVIKTKNIDEILLSTNDDKCIAIAEPFLKKDKRLKILRRPDVLCLDTTNLQDLIAYVPTVTKAKHILWGHVTTPIVDSADYDEAVNIYFSNLKGGYDSLVGVLELRNFILNKRGKIINNSSSILWPSTQDLDVLYEINHTIFLTSREVYEFKKNRIGNNPFLYLMNKLKSIDIDWEDDFMIAESLIKNAPPPPIIFE